MSLDDLKFMKMALVEASKASEKAEVPVGAVLVGSDGKILAKAHNMRETWQTSLGHAEIIAIQTASKKLGQWRLLDTTLYVTLEPCPMCAGALVQARVKRIVYGATDPKAGATHSLYQICSDPRLNHQIEVERGVMESECAQVLKDFFKRRRLEKKNV